MLRIASEVVDNLNTKLIIDDSNFHEHVEPEVDGEKKIRGLIPRNFVTHPQGCYKSASPFDLKLIARSEWPEIIRQMTADKSRLSDVRLTANKGQPIPSLDQNGVGYCWAHSSTHAVMALRAVANQPYIPLSAFAVASIIKNYRDEGGWGALSLDFITERGVPSQQFWPQKQRDRRYDTPETWANAALHKTTEGWVDTSAAVYDRDLSFDQVMTLLLCGIPVVGDFNWWGHSVCLLDPVDCDPSLDLNDLNRWGVNIWNSWSDQWGTLGMGVLRGRKAIPDGAVAPRVTKASAA